MKNPMVRRKRRNDMLLIFLEAMLALVLFLLLIWWTMFSGRKGGELHRDADEAPAAKPPGKNPKP